MQSVFAAARHLGFAVAASYALQGLASVAAMMLALRVWSRTERLPMRAAALVIATLLATPYLYDYDLVLLALPLGWLAAEGLAGGFLPWEKAILALGWMMPMFCRPLGALLFPLTPLTLALMLWATVRRAESSSSAATAPRAILRGSLAARAASL